jgi:hypothetical protein
MWPNGSVTIDHRGAYDVILRDDARQLPNGVESDTRTQSHDGITVRCFVFLGHTRGWDGPGGATSWRRTPSCRCSGRIGLLLRRDDHPEFILLADAQLSGRGIIVVGYNELSCSWYVSYFNTS